MHTHVHGHTGTPCRYRCVSFINPMPALLAGQDRGLQLTKCPQAEGIFGWPFPTNTIGPQEDKPGSSWDITPRIEELLPKPPCPREFQLAGKNVQRLAWISCTPPIGQVLYTILQCMLGFPGGSEVKASACNAADLGSIPGLGRSPGEGNGNPLQYSCLENPMDGGAWWATVHGVAKSRTRLSDLTLTFHSVCYSSERKAVLPSFINVRTKVSENESESRSVVYNSLQPHGLYSPWNSPGQNTGVGSLSLLQGIFPTQGSSPGLPHCRWILYQLRPREAQRTVEYSGVRFQRESILTSSPSQKVAELRFKSRNPNSYFYYL